MKGIQIASNAEWRSVINYCQAKTIETSPYGPYFLHQFPFWKEEAVIYFSGYSKSKAAGAAQFMISKFNLEHVIVAGTCGGVASHLEPLDVVIATETVVYDCIDRLENQTQLFHEDFICKINVSQFDGKALPEKTYLGRVATADQDIDFSVRSILEPEHVLVADWESGAVALVCKLNRVAVSVYRGISDKPTSLNTTEEQADQYRLNTPLIMKRIFEQYLPLED